VADLVRLLETLETCYGPQRAVWPTDPYLSLVWWHAGYPASDATCAKGFESLQRSIGLEPERILKASDAKLTLALKPGGMVPELRALRLKEIADVVQEDFEGDLEAGLKEMPLARARTVLKKFPGIGDPGADRLLLFGGIAAVAAVPSNVPQVIVRMLRGKESDNYGRNYSESQKAIEGAIPEDFEARQRAYLLVKRHGQEICKRTNPKCSVCPVAQSCAFAE
jgi:endonuclease III